MAAVSGTFSVYNDQTSQRGAEFLFVSELISEPLTPIAGSFDTRAMGRGEPGLPAGFTWRERTYAITHVLETWKHSEREGGSGERYLRRHYFKVRMDDGAVWTVYLIRKTPKSGNVKQRWFLYTRESGDGGTEGRRDGARDRGSSKKRDGAIDKKCLNKRNRERR
jgi:hypothetical protein